MASALNCVGFHLLCKAKRLWAAGDENSAKEMLQQAHGKIAASLERRPDNPTTLGNQGYILFLLGNEAEAKTILIKAVLLGGEPLRAIELKDADIHTIPPDVAFREFIRSIPST